MSTSEFCPDCQNILYPKEDREYRQLLYFCNSCSYTEFADLSSKEKNTVEFTAFNYRTKDDVHSYIAHGLADDPTLPRAPERVCSECQHVGAVYLQLPDRVADEAMVIVYVCCNTSCNFFEMENPISKGGYDQEEDEDVQEEISADQIEDLGDDFLEVADPKIEGSGLEGIEGDDLERELMGDVTGYEPVQEMDGFEDEDLFGEEGIGDLEGEIDEDIIPETLKKEEVDMDDFVPMTQDEDGDVHEEDEIVGGHAMGLELERH